MFVLVLVTLLPGCGGVHFGCVGAGGNTGAFSDTTFTAPGDAELIARVTVDCDACDWQTTGSEAVVLAITLDDHEPIYLPVVRSGDAEYRVMLGRVAAGRHTATIKEDPNLTATSLRGKAEASYAIEVEQIPVNASNHQALSLAPFVYARPDTVGKFTDVPLLMWYEIEPTERGSRYRYSVIFSNEDGGTPADRLMATWGRTTDIEYLYSVEVDASGAILSEDMQGPDHEILPFTGKREGRHPLVWVSTENNMVLDHGTTTVRYAPAPEVADLKDVSREVVMDANAWTYEVMTKELAREGKIVAGAAPGQGTIPDPRGYVFLEGCGEAGHNALAIGVKVNDRWLSSDRGVPDYRIVRDGCFRAAVPLPGNTSARDVKAIRVQVFPRKNKPAGTPSRLTRLNALFSLDERFVPSPGPVVNWQGNSILQPDGSPFEIAVK